MKKTIFLQQRNCHAWAEKHSVSELMIRHLIGERYFYVDDGGSIMADIITLASLHGWEVNITVL